MGNRKAVGSVRPILDEIRDEANSLIPGKVISVSEITNEDPDTGNPMRFMSVVTNIQELKQRKAVAREIRDKLSLEGYPNLTLHVSFGK